MWRKDLFLAIIIALFSPIFLFAQIEVSRVDHARQNSHWNYRLYEVYSYNTFQDFQAFSQVIDFSDIDYPLLHAALFFETNRIRVENGVDPVKWNLQLEITAYNHSLFMVEKYEFAHYSGISSRRSPNDRAVFAGIANPRVSENIAINFGLDYVEDTPYFIHGNDIFSYSNDPSDPLRSLTYAQFASKAIDLWMGSPPHRRNLLNKNAVQLGTGAYFYRDANSGYFPKFRTTQNFQWFAAVEAMEPLDPLPPGYDIDALPMELFHSIK